MGFMPVPSSGGVQRPGVGSIQPPSPPQVLTVQPAAAPPAPPPTLQTADTSKVPAHHMPIVTTLTRLFNETSEALGGSCANPAKMQEIEDNSKRLEFLKAKCLMNCEFALILEHKCEQLQQSSDDPMNQISQVFEKSLQYVKHFSRHKNPNAVRQVRDCVLGNLCPETVEEAIAMVPSIKTRGRAQDYEAVEKMLNDLSLIKKFE